MLDGHSLWWHPESGAHEDYWISAINAYYHRIAWIDQRYAFTQAGTFKGKGGLAAHRTVDSEKRSFELLRKAFGSEVIRKKQGTARAGITHDFQPLLRLPFG